MQKLTDKLQRLSSRTEDYYYKKYTSSTSETSTTVYSQGHRYNQQSYAEVYGEVPQHSGGRQKAQPLQNYSHQQMFYQASPGVRNSKPVKVTAPLAPGTPMSPSRIPSYLPQSTLSGPNDGVPAGLMFDAPSVPFPVYTPQKNPNLPQHQKEYVGGNPNLLTPNSTPHKNDSLLPPNKNVIPTKSEWEREKAQIEAEINRDMAKFDGNLTHLVPESSVMFEGTMCVNESRFIQRAQEKYGGPAADALPDPPANTEYINPMGFAKKNTINLTGNAGVTVYSRSESSGY